jgi:hypothetical protein
MRQRRPGVRPALGVGTSGWREALIPTSAFVQKDVAVAEDGHAPSWFR